jgi:preprotein translocase subunit SecG
MSFLLYLSITLFIIVCIFLVLVILIQKGRGGGLASAFGGAGGNTAFGSKTGDVLTWVTAVVFGIFILLAVALNLLSDYQNRKRMESAKGQGLEQQAPPTPATPSAPSAPAAGGAPAVPVAPPTTQPR